MVRRVTKVRIGFDVDGVLYGWHERVYEYMKSAYGFRGTMGKLFVDLNNPKIYGEGFIKQIVEKKEFYSGAPYKLAVSFLEELARDYELHYITARPLPTTTLTKAWFKEWKFPYQENVVVVTGDKSAEVLERRLTYYVEDRDKYALELKDLTKIILVRKPWNEHIQDQFDCVDSVLELGNYLE